MISRWKYSLLSALPLAILLLTSSLASARPLGAVSLPEGRTYDQAHDAGYIDWKGRVQYVRLFHKDGASLPPDEGGTYCGAGCWEKVTRISNGSSVSGSFARDAAYFEVMAAFSHAAEVGNAVLTACSQKTVYKLYAGPGSSPPGFISIPLGVPAGCRAWTLAASGGYVDFRSVDVNYAPASPTATVTRTLPPTSTPTRASVPSATPTRTATSTATRAATFTFTPTPTNTFTATATQTSTASRTPTPTATYTLTPSSTNTATATATATQTATPSRPPTSTAAWTFTPSATNTAAYPPTPIFTQTPTFTATVTHTLSRTPTFTPAITARPPAVFLTRHWWIWESGVIRIIPKTHPIVSVKLTISDPQNRCRQ